MQTVQQRPTTTAAPHRSHGWLSSEAQAHRRRCKTLAPVQPGEAERLMANFLATKAVTVCPARYLVPTEQRPQLV
jgi:hypothetical protein